MFERFGEFDSVEEMNHKAEELKAKGNGKELKELCRENGLDMEDADDYMDGAARIFATPLMAAVGKLKVERDELKLEGILSDWVDELMNMASEREEFARSVRRKGKDLAGYMAKTADSGYDNRVVVDERIVKKTKRIKTVAGNHEFSIGIPDKKARRQLAEEYYEGSGAK